MQVAAVWERGGGVEARAAGMAAAVDEAMDADAGDAGETLELLVQVGGVGRDYTASVLIISL